MAWVGPVGSSMGTVRAPSQHQWDPPVHMQESRWEFRAQWELDLPRVSSV